VPHYNHAHHPTPHPPDYFSFSIIDACGSVADVRSQIERELRYQSSLDLDASTYAAIRHLPLAADLVREARQALVASLDRHNKRHGRQFGEVVRLITAEVVPLLRRCALAGHAEYVTSSPILASPRAQRMLVDVLTDRGFAVAHRARVATTPASVDLATGAITCDTVTEQSFRVTFDRGAAGAVRDAGGRGVGEGEPQEALGVGTVAPPHVDHQGDPAPAVPAAEERAG